MQSKTEHANDTVGELRASAGPSTSNLFALMMVLTAALAVGCQSTSRLPERPGYVSDPEAYVSRLRKADNVVKEEPSFVVSVPDGERLLFFVDEHDEGVAVLGEVPSYSTRGSALDHPQLQDATPAMIYYAVTKDDSEIPEVLVAHHDGVAREFDLAQLEVALEGRDRGWFLTEPPNTQSSSPCANATFTTNICAHPEYDEAVCKKNTSGSWIWRVPGAYRYKAGFCLQRGRAQSWLSYEHVRWNDQQGWCEGCRVLHVAWGWESLSSGEKWSATTYLVYVWWKGAGSSWARSFEHVAGFGTGDVFDWGQRYSWKRCQCFD